MQTPTALQKSIFLTVSITVFVLLLTSIAIVDISVAQNCDLTASSLPSFGTLGPEEISGDGISTTLENTGDTDITSLDVSGTDWESSFSVGQTKWSLNDGSDYNGMTALSSANNPLGITPFVSGNTQNVFFKVKIPNDQASGRIQPNDNVYLRV